jgi:hypothetical protein
MTSQVAIVHAGPCTLRIMWDLEKEFRVKLGGNYYINCGSLISVNGQPLFTVKRRDDGVLGIDFDIYDKDRTKIATIRGGTIVAANGGDYVFRIGVDHYRIEDAAGKMICDIKRKGKAQNAELEVAVDLFTPSGFHLIATPESTNIGGATMIGNTFKDCGTAINIR